MATVSQSMVIAESPCEVAFLAAYRATDEAGRKRIRKLLAAGLAGLLPPVEVVESMKPDELQAFADASPEAAQ